MWKDIEEGVYQVKIFVGDIGDEEYGIYFLIYELSSGIDVVFLVFDKSWYFVCFGIFENFFDLCNSFFKNVRRVDINFGDNDYDWYVKCQSKIEMFFVYFNKIVIGCNYE